ncbi:MAG: hypothetical protein A2Y25_07570 [Candidatus Melainabacteria bacterium GWF2_37_15]|nr:MAG: hypothetical protein A2Y25_07570 [Candidatus Melainabacteria bacterium GWF2_37_15]
MLEQVRTNKFKKEVKLAQKRSKNMEKLKTVVLKLLFGESLEEKYRDHNLTGNYNGCRECHIEPDWLLIYTIDLENNKLWLFRTGSHADLFE